MMHFSSQEYCIITLKGLYSLYIESSVFEALSVISQSICPKPVYFPEKQINISLMVP